VGQNHVCTALRHHQANSQPLIAACWAAPCVFLVGWSCMQVSAPAPVSTLVTLAHAMTYMPLSTRNQARFRRCFLAAAAAAPSAAQIVESQIDSSIKLVTEKVYMTHEQEREGREAGEDRFKLGGGQRLRRCKLQVVVRGKLADRCSCNKLATTPPLRCCCRSRHERATVWLQGCVTITELRAKREREDERPYATNPIRSIHHFCCCFSAARA